MERRPGSSPAGRPASRPTVVVAAVIALVVLIGVVVGVRTRTAGDGWSSVWTENFNGSAGAAASDQTWTQTTGTKYAADGAPEQWGTGEIETYTADRANSKLDGNGNLVITASKDAAGAWTSARLEAKRADFQAAPGGILKAEARVKVPSSGPGFWPAFWMLGDGFRKDPGHSWPGIGEIDILEQKGVAPSQVFGTLHCGTAPGGPCNENNGIGGSTTASAPLADAFHTYSVQWDRTTSPEQIRWYLDGKQFHVVSETDMPADVWANATHHGFFILLNMAVGGSFGGPPDATTKASGSMVVDWVKVSKR